MERITYILGAGFSAPAGLPVMSNFYFKAQDMYSQDPQQYKHFETVFKKIAQLSVCKNHYNSDLFNIEEILSLMEMQDFLGQKRNTRSFIRFIQDVINYYSGKNLLLYKNFVASLFRLAIIYDKSGMYAGYSTIKSDTRYSVISLNYDLMLEDSIKSFYKKSSIHLHHYEAGINQAFDYELQFNKDSYDPEWEFPHLAKLHGCISDGSIIPPTWNKGNNRNIKKTWELAYKILSDSTEIRFMGYSLPTTDLYIKYLLKASVATSPKIRKICVIDLNAENNPTYNDFILSNKQLKNGNIKDYLNSITCRDTGGANPKITKYDLIEFAHNQFMDRATQKSPQQ